LDSSLVANKNLSEMLPSSSLGVGPDEVGQKGVMLLHSQKIQKPNYFFHWKL